MRPVYAFDLVRRTNAPLEVVARALEGGDLAPWHPRLRSVDLRVEVRTPGRFEALYVRRAGPGLEEAGRFEAVLGEDGVLLTHRLRFRGWLVLLGMGWWRVRSRRLWEAFVAALPPPGGEE